MIGSNPTATLHIWREQSTCKPSTNPDANLSLSDRCVSDEHQRSYNGECTIGTFGFVYTSVRLRTFQCADCMCDPILVETRPLGVCQPGETDGSSMIVGCAETPDSSTAAVLIALFVLLLCGLCAIAGYHIVRRQRQPMQQYVYIQAGRARSGLADTLLKPASSRSALHASEEDRQVADTCLQKNATSLLSVEEWPTTSGDGESSEVAAFCRGLGLGRYASALEKDFGINTLSQLKALTEQQLAEAIYDAGVRKKIWLALRSRK